MMRQDIIDKTFKYFYKFKDDDIVVNPSLPILYFGDLKAYNESNRKILTVVINPSNNEFKIKKQTCIHFVLKFLDKCYVQ